MSKHGTKEDAPVGDPKLVAKLAEVFNARTLLDGEIDSLRTFFNHRLEGEDFGVRLLACLLWTSELQTKLIQAQIIAKGEEE